MQTSETTLNSYRPIPCLILHASHFHRSQANSAAYTSPIAIRLQSSGCAYALIELPCHERCVATKNVVAIAPRSNLLRHQARIHDRTLHRFHRSDTDDLSSKLSFLSTHALVHIHARNSDFLASRTFCVLRFFLLGTHLETPWPNASSPPTSPFRAPCAAEPSPLPPVCAHRHLTVSKSVA